MTEQESSEYSNIDTTFLLAFFHIIQSEGRSQDNWLPSKNELGSRLFNNNFSLFFFGLTRLEEFKMQHTLDELSQSEREFYQNITEQLYTNEAFVKFQQADGRASLLIAQAKTFAMQRVALVRRLSRINNEEISVNNVALSSEKRMLFNQLTQATSNLNRTLITIVGCLTDYGLTPYELHEMGL